VSQWPRETAASLIAGMLGAAAIMISPIAPWPLNVALGLTLLAGRGSPGDQPSAAQVQIFQPDGRYAADGGA
jgi:hypothetical protein